MDAQGTMRLMFDTMDAYDRADFDRLAEIYAEDAQWRNADPNGPHCRNRDDIFTMFRQRRSAGTRIQFDELRSTPTQVLVTARAADFGGVVSVFSFQGRRITSVKDYRPWRPPRQPLRDRAGHRPIGGGAVCGGDGGQGREADPGSLSGAAPLRCRPAARCR
jgi:SnoaL-like domain